MPGLFSLVLYSRRVIALLGAGLGSLPLFYSSQWTIGHHYRLMAYAIVWHRFLVDNYSNTGSRSE